MYDQVEHVEPDNISQGAQDNDGGEINRDQARPNLLPYAR